MTPPTPTAPVSPHTVAPRIPYDGTTHITFASVTTDDMEVMHGLMNPAVMQEAIRVMMVALFPKPKLLHLAVHRWEVQSGSGDVVRYLPPGFERNIRILGRVARQALPHRAINAANAERPESTNIKTPHQLHMVLKPPTYLTSIRHDHHQRRQQTLNITSASPEASKQEDPLPFFRPPPQPAGF